MSLINLWILYVTFVDIIMLRQAQFPIILVKACQEQENISKHLLQSKWFYLKVATRTAHIVLWWTKPSSCRNSL